jgi:hypothetical protein
MCIVVGVDEDDKVVALAENVTMRRAIWSHILFLQVQMIVNNQLNIMSSAVKRIVFIYELHSGLELILGPVSSR